MKKKKNIARAIALRVTADRLDCAGVWSVALWLATLAYLLATFSPTH